MGVIGRVDVVHNRECLSKADAIFEFVENYLNIVG
jgi:hypothetical protein